MKTKLEIIDETVAFYETDPSRRAEENNSCLYTDSRGNRCALGRYFTPEMLEATGDFKGSFKTLLAKLDRDPDDEVFLPEYRGHDLEFWEELQAFHDEYDLWTPPYDTLTRPDKIEYLRKAWATPRP